MGLLGLQHSATAGQTGSWQAIDTIFPNATPRCDTVAIGQSVAKVSTHLLAARYLTRFELHRDAERVFCCY
jgi:hypothetical protein